MIDPVAQTQMVRALVDIYRHEGNHVSESSTLEGVKANP
jgi:hypothetical protein